jgi:hypothetical protein
VPSQDTDWHEWHRDYDDPSSSLSRRLRVVQQLVEPLVSELGPEHRVLSLCAGDGRDVIPVVASRPPALRPRLVLVELDAALAIAARQRAETAGVDATVITGDAGRSVTWREHVPADLLMLCGIFGNIRDADIERTVVAARSMLSPHGSVVWTRGAFGDVDLRPRIRSWFDDAGFEEVAFESEAHGYGVGVNRRGADATSTPLPDHLFTFTR